MLEKGRISNSLKLESMDERTVELIGIKGSLFSLLLCSNVSSHTNVLVLL